MRGMPRQEGRGGGGGGDPPPTTTRRPPTRKSGEGGDDHAARRDRRRIERRKQCLCRGVRCRHDTHALINGGCKGRRAALSEDEEVPHSLSS